MEPSSRNFSATELRCKCQSCMMKKPNRINPKSLERLQKLRDMVGFPLFITSAYRCELHPAEARKKTPGRHFKGMAFDIAVPWGMQRMIIVEAAIKLGFKGFGFGKNFLHIDDDGDDFRSWSYS